MLHCDFQVTSQPNRTFATMASGTSV